MRPPGEAPADGRSRFGTPSLVLGAASFVALGLSCVPLLGCIGTPLGLLASLVGVVLGVVAIVDGSRRGDSAERARGIAGVALGLLLPAVMVLGAVVFRDNLRELFAATSGHGLVGAAPARDAGAPDGG